MRAIFFARQGTSLRLATRPWLLTPGEYGGKGPPGKPGVPAAVERRMEIIRRKFFP